MARRLIETISGPNGDRVAKVYRDAEWNEYVVRFTEFWVNLPEASNHHTDDKLDALGTARHWVNSTIPTL